MNGHVRQTCDPPCDASSCCACNLYCCGVCGGAEGSLPHECPGQGISTEDQQLIYKGTLDFRGGQWIRRGYERWEAPNPEKEIIIDAAVVRLNEVRVCTSSPTP